jgi:RimJ/RimL family protein N-acetyltransferase
LERLVINITYEQVTEKLRALFDPAQPASIRCFAVLDGFSRGGEIFTDDPDDPTWGIVREPTDSTIYIGGQPEVTVLHEVIAQIRNTNEVLIGLWDHDPWLEKLPPNPDYVGKTLEWTKRPLGQSLDHLIAPLPADVRIEPFGPALFPRTEWYEGTVAWHGSVERFFDMSGGFCLMREDEILGEASYGRCSRTWAEMGILIYPPYRQRGYATALSARTVQACEARGLQTYWNTAKQNLPSAAIARRLGCRTEREYNLIAWFK